MKLPHFCRIAALLLTVFFLSGCNAYLHQPMQSQKARIGEETTFTQHLRNLPPPKEKMVVAVYKFRDQTGQYKPSETGASWSTAVTQGGTNILLKALDDSGWFVPIERENVSNLLNERKIIRSSRQQFLDEQDNLLPPLLYAGIIIEGGIVSYDANLITGGFGLRYFGTGGGGQYRQDRVTVYLRVISTKTGKILKTVYTSKTLLSQAIDVGVFRFVSFQRLLEAETGITYNEPSELAVTEAIEKGVHSLIMEGLLDSLWTVNEAAQNKASEAIAAYKEEKIQMRQTDVFGSRPERNRKSSSVQASYSALRYEGDYANPLIKSGYELGIDQTLSERFSLGLIFGTGRLGSAKDFDIKFSYGEIFVKYRFLPQSRFSPMVQAGIGMLFNKNFNNNKQNRLFAGVGFEYLITDNLGLTTSFDNNYLTSDTLDGIVHGKYNDYYWRSRLGMIFYFGLSRQK